MIVQVVKECETRGEQAKENIRNFEFGGQCDLDKSLNNVLQLVASCSCSNINTGIGLLFVFRCFGLEKIPVSVVCPCLLPVQVWCTECPVAALSCCSAVLFALQ